MNGAKRPLQKMKSLQDLTIYLAMQLRSVLTELGAPPENPRATVDATRKSLRVQIGLKARRIGPP